MFVGGHVLVYLGMFLFVPAHEGTAVEERLAGWLAVRSQSWLVLKVGPLSDPLGCLLY